MKIGFLGILTITFIILKVTDKIDWPWIWVLAPAWLPPAIVLGFMGFMLIVGSIVAILVTVLEK